MPNKVKEKIIAKKRINILFNRAKIAIEKGDIELSRRYTRLILILSRKYKIRLEKDIKRRICKKCGTILVPGITLSVRIRNKQIVYRCLYCGNITRYPFSRYNISENNK